MLSEQQLIGYIDDTLAADERAAVEEALADDPAEDMMVLVSQRRLDAALRAVLADEETIRRMKEAILAAAGAPSTQEIKTRVLRRAGRGGRTYSIPWRFLLLAGGILVILLGLIHGGLLPRWRAAGVVLTEPPVVVGAAAGRDFFWRPFAATSPWNTRLGTGAHYEPLSGNAARVDVLHVGVRWRTIVQADASVRSRPVYLDGAHVADVPLAEGIENQRYDDDLFCTAKERDRYAVEMLAPGPGPDGGVAVRKLQRIDLHSSGFAPDGSGLAVHGGSAFGGAVRRGELQQGIRHALVVSYNRSGLNQRGPDGRPFVWPASQVDLEASTHFSTQGNVFIGSLLAIPPDIDIAQFGFGKEGPAIELARALQDYGAYVVESCDSQWMNFYVSDAGLSAEQLAPILERLARELQVVANNGPRTPGGGGRRPQ